MRRAQHGTVVTEVSQVDDNAAYHRLWRERRPELHRAAQDRQNLRLRAMRILAQRHADELDAIIAELADGG